MVAISEQTYNTTIMRGLRVLDSTLCREEEKSTALSIYGKVLSAWLLIFLTLLQVHFLNVEAGHASFPMSMLVALVLWPIIVLDGVQSVSSIVYQCIYVQFPRVQFLYSRLNLISS